MTGAFRDVDHTRPMSRSSSSFHRQRRRPRAPYRLLGDANDVAPGRRVEDEARRCCRGSISRHLRCLSAAADSRLPQSRRRRLHLRRLRGRRQHTPEESVDMVHDDASFPARPAHPGAMVGLARPGGLLTMANWFLLVDAITGSPRNDWASFAGEGWAAATKQHAHDLAARPIFTSPGCRTRRSRSRFGCSGDREYRADRRAHRCRSRAGCRRWPRRCSDRSRTQRRVAASSWAISTSPT